MGWLRPVGHPRPGDLPGEGATDPRPRRSVRHSGAAPRIGAYHVSTRRTAWNGAWRSYGVNTGGFFGERSERLVDFY